MNKQSEQQAKLMYQKKAKRYFQGWPNSGKYVEDLMYAARASAKILEAIKKRPSTSGKPRCVVFDIDDTLVFGDPAQVLGVDEKDIGVHNGQQVFILPANDPIVKLAYYARANGFAVIVLTARPPTSKEASLYNLKYLKIPYNVLLMNDSDSYPEFKLNTRRQISKKYDIALTIGDQITDCLCCGAMTAGVKLPCDESFCTYIYPPPGININFDELQLEPF